MAPAAVTVRVSSTGDDTGNTRYFDTEMLALNIQGGALPPGVMIRESPTKQSLGRTSVQQLTGGAAGAGKGAPVSYDISSSFDIFTEVSTDGGQTWNPALTGPVSMMLENETSPPCAGPAAMQIVRGASSVTVSWTGGDFRLQVTDLLQGAQTVWQDVGVTSPVTLIANPDQTQFYRLICP